MNIHEMTRDELKAACRTKLEAAGQPTSWLVSANKDSMIAYLEGRTAAPSPAMAAAANEVEELTRKLTEAIAKRSAPPAPTVDLSEINQRIDTVRDDLAGKIGALGSQISPLMDLVDNVKTATIAPSRIPIIAASKPGSIMAALSSRYEAGKLCPAIACLLSPPSFGKSYAVRELGRSYDTYLEHGCSGDVDEVATLCGTVAPDGKGGFVTVDGVLSQAVREASTGKNVIVLLDEVFRLRDDAANWLLTFLTPSIQADGTRLYKLRTKRPAADGSWEVVACPAERLHVVCAANLGHSRPNEAFWSRLDKVRVPATADSIAEIARAVMVSFSISHGSSAPLAFANAMLASRRLVAEGKLAYPLDIRVLVRACERAPAPDWACVKAGIIAQLEHSCALWDGDLGDTVEASKEAALALGGGL